MSRVTGLGTHVEKRGIEAKTGGGAAPALRFVSRATRLYKILFF